MSSTRSSSHPAATIEAVIVAHGLPSDPEPQEKRIQALAARVAQRLGRARVVGTTLAMPGGLDRAVAACEAPLVYPLFMADGWFVSRELPRRLKAAGGAAAHLLPPFGLDPALHRLAVERLREAADSPDGTTVLIAAHGSPNDPRPAAAARSLADRMSEAGFRQVVCGFIDEAPFLADAARGLRHAICLPFFARRAGHVENDLPEALAEAGFGGPVLQPIGEDPEVPAIIAAGLVRQRQTA